jgi:hypothetical protein
MYPICDLLLIFIAPMPPVEETASILRPPLVGSVVLYNISQNDNNCVEVQGVYIEGRGAAANPNPNLYDKKTLTCITRNIV